MLDEWESKKALTPFGLSMPEGRLCNEDEVVQAAAAIGYPVCLKIVSSEIAHKSEVGGVKLNLESSHQLADALDSMKHLGSQFLVEIMIQDPVADRLAAYRAMGLTVFEVALKADPEGSRATLSPWLAGQRSFVLGPSGTGKSTLINLLVHDAQAQVGEISQALNSGRHTTTTTQWYWTDDSRTTALIDSPGFQEFGLRQIDAAELWRYMPDLREH
ncbi:MAG: GTPase RsgA, partial [Proteobacteria bacterium]|nr:GTPase RsgA [Pseudomonadota bacterium]